MITQKLKVPKDGELDEISEEEDNDSFRPTNAKQMSGLIQEGQKIGNSMLHKRHTVGYIGSSLMSEDDTDLLTNNDELDSMMNPVLYHRGIRSEHFFLIISGKVAICSGNEGFIIEKGRFEFIGMECLTNRDYVPDFSCKVLGQT